MTSGLLTLNPPKPTETHRNPPSQTVNRDAQAHRASHRATRSAPVSANHALAHLKHLMGWCVERGMIGWRVDRGGQAAQQDVRPCAAADGARRKIRACHLSPGCAGR